MDELTAWQNRYEPLDQVNEGQRSVGEKNRAEAGVDKREPLDQVQIDPTVIGQRRYMGDNERGWASGR